MIKYEYKKPKGCDSKKFIENGHTMFEEDVLMRLNRLAHLEHKLQNQANGVKMDSKALHIDSVKARYFRVTFSANHPKGAANGAVMYVTNGTYLGGAETIADIEKTNGVTNVAILSITELAEDDYNYYMNH